MKVINKILCLLSVLVLCVPLLCFNVSADDSSELTLEEYYLTGCTGDWSSMSVDSISGSSFSTSFPNFGIVNNRGDLVTYDCSDVSARFKLGYACMFKSAFETFVNDDIQIKDYYYIIRYGSLDFDSYERYCVSTFYSESPISLSSDNSLVSSSSIYESHLNIANINGYCQKDFPDTCWGNVGYSTYPSPCTLFNDKLPFNQNLNFNVTEIYSNCITEYNGNKVSERPKSSALKDNIEVKLTPEFGLDMDILNSSDDRFKFSVTNNTDKPIQFCVYIDEPGNDNSYLGDYVVNPAYTNALWNYKIDSYYYDIDITDNSKYLGFVVDNLISPVKCHGTIVWVYLDSGLTYSDYVYWKNVSLATGKHYNINFLACYVPDNLDIVSNIFDVELLSDPIVLSDFNSELRNDHWWTIDFLSKVVISDKMNSYKLSYEDVSTIYQANFSLVSIPDYSSVSVGGNGIVSNGYKNDLSEFHEKDYSYNLDTGKEVFNSTGSFSNDFNMNDVSVDNVKSYISYCTDFFSLIKGTLSTFPEFIWVLIFFGLSAFVVIAIVKWIIS